MTSPTRTYVLLTPTLFTSYAMTQQFAAGFPVYTLTASINRKAAYIGGGGGSNRSGIKNGIVLSSLFPMLNSTRQAMKSILPLSSQTKS